MKRMIVAMPSGTIHTVYLRRPKRRSLAIPGAGSTDDERLLLSELRG